ncbi:restriction endonuclease subunit S, partial [Enterococcus thailandicus]|uniref:restriction endonuclease subunit S n=1 Tax=Enterococcus thailandicus TaxID=417368 RepID=UPI0022EBD2E3
MGELTSEFKSGSSIKAENIFELGSFPVYGGNGFRGYTDTFNHDGDFALIGRQGALSGNMNFSVGKAYFTEHAVAVKANENNDTRFLYYLMDKLKLGRWVTQSAQPGLAVGTLTEIKASVPNNFEEQQKIGIFFKQLDDTTALHQQKLDQLKRLKQSFLQILFGNKEQAPKVRFAGFDEEWEQRK